MSTEPEKVKTLTLVKQLTNNMKMIAALPRNQHPEKRFAELTRDPDEKASDYRERALKVIGKWWGYAPTTVRMTEEGHRFGQECPELLDDLERYGAVEFETVNKRTRLVKESIGRGPKATEYMRAVSTIRKTARPSRPAAST